MAWEKGDWASSGLLGSGKRPDLPERHGGVALSQVAQHEPGLKASRLAVSSFRQAVRQLEAPDEACAGENEMPYEPPRIRVLLADDHPILRRGLAMMLREEEDMEVVGEAADGQEAVELAHQLLPDVVLMDVTMPRLDGVEATRLIRAALPQVQVIGLSMHDEADLADRMCKAGAAAYLSKGGDPDALIETIRRVGHALSSA